jgi:hypothetical protein
LKLQSAAGFSFAAVGKLAPASQTKRDRCQRRAHGSDVYKSQIPVVEQTIERASSCSPICFGVYVCTLQGHMAQLCDGDPLIEFATSERTMRFGRTVARFIGHFLSVTVPIVDALRVVIMRLQVGPFEGVCSDPAHHFIDVLAEVRYIENPTSVLQVGMH